MDSRSPARPMALSRWLFVIAGLVFAMVLVGGITRLTESGLSITEWKPISGAIPPLSKADWQHEFDLYRATPQYQQVAGPSGMTLALSVVATGDAPPSPARRLPEPPRNGVPAKLEAAPAAPPVTQAAPPVIQAAPPANAAVPPTPPPPAPAIPRPSAAGSSLRLLFSRAFQRGGREAGAPPAGPVAGASPQPAPAQPPQPSPTHPPPPPVAASLPQAPPPAALAPQPPVAVRPPSQPAGLSATKTA